MERIKDYLLLEEEFVQNQELLKPQEEKTQVRDVMPIVYCALEYTLLTNIRGKHNRRSAHGSTTFEEVRCMLDLLTS